MITTIEILLPTGTKTHLALLNRHDMRQYYCYQMDMLEQAEGIFSILGIECWRNGDTLDRAPNVARKTKPAAAFLAAPAKGNLMPTRYDVKMWQGSIIHSDGSRTYPYVDEMTTKQLTIEIKKQHLSLANFQAATVALANLAGNIAGATQPPESPAP